MAAKIRLKCQESTTTAIDGEFLANPKVLAKISFRPMGNTSSSKSGAKVVAGSWIFAAIVTHWI
ncbi:MAG: hypothetical protein ACFFEU_02795 [Candidatus Thorarchaeota archaeon]